MGNISQFSCPDCRQAWRVNLGHGMNHAMLNTVLEAFSEQTRQKIVGCVGGRQILYFDFNYRAAVCSRCGNIVEIPVLKLPEIGETFVGECPECDHSAEIIKDGETPMCPHCGAAALEETPLGHWD